ncbi:unnamed protein product [Lactuca saligna]|uniref:Uncharacterized protein n=1 Tax=Lactuca saligna TaxID=75948 RepID=A0AA36E4X4_LACSI|nr:unnamed protein product [Lactuca saligna]
MGDFKTSFESNTAEQIRGEAKKVSTEEIKKPACGSDEHEQKPPKSKDQKDNEAEEKARKSYEAQVTLETQKILFVAWSMERILNESIDNPSVYWLEPVTLFELENTLDSQLDFPITLKAFLFRSFGRVENALESTNNVNLMLISFYLKHDKPQYQTLSSKKITAVMVIGQLKPKASLMLDLKLLEEPIVAYLKRMLVSYIHEVGKMDVEIAVVLRKKAIIKPKEALCDVYKVKLGKIHKDNWNLVFQQSARDGSNSQRCFFSLSDKHLYSTSYLNYVLELIEKSKATDTTSKK